LAFSAVTVWAGAALSSSPKEDKAQQAKRVELVRKTMGTRFHVQAYVHGAEQERALAAALDEVERLNDLWSPWEAASDVARLNASAGRAPVKVAPETYALIERSVRVCEGSDRAFDPTFYALAPLYDLSASDFKPPTAARLEALLPKVDCRKIKLDPRAGTVFLQERGMAIHLGGNAKGAGLDAAARVLAEAGIERFCVDGGGDIVAKGEGPKGPWRVGIQHPRAPRGKVLAALRADAGAVATSGDYERFVMVEGKRVHHILDPRDGRPARGCMSATVVVPPGPHAGELADAWATALCVLGPRKGLRRVEQGVADGAASVYTLDGRVYKTPRFPVSLPELRQAD
jgi:FAD:protein FMN transferase